MNFSLFWNTSTTEAQALKDALFIILPTCLFIHARALILAIIYDAVVWWYDCLLALVVLILVRVCQMVNGLMCYTSLSTICYKLPFTIRCFRCKSICCICLTPTENSTWSEKLPGSCNIRVVELRWTNNINHTKKLQRDTILTVKINIIYIYFV